MNIPFYYDLTNTTTISDTYLSLLGAFIYSQKQNEPCTVYDPIQLISQSLRYNPQLRLLTNVPENTNELSVNSCVNLVSSVKFTDIQKASANLFQYMPDFNRSILQVLEQASIKTSFDIGVHVVPGANLQFYADIIKDYQKKSKKATLAVYVMAESYSLVLQLQSLCDPSWKLTSLSKIPAKDGTTQAFRELAEVQIFAITPAAVLNFSYALDRFIYIMNRSPKGYEYFREVNGAPWSLTGPPAPLAAAAAAPTPLTVPAPTAAPTAAATAAPTAALNAVATPLTVPAPTPLTVPAPTRVVLPEVNASTVTPSA
jgi:hypothetical protein